MPIVVRPALLKCMFGKMTPPWISRRDLIAKPPLPLFVTFAVVVIDLVERARLRIVSGEAPCRRWRGSCVPARDRATLIAWRGVFTAAKLCRDVLPLRPIDRRSTEMWLYP